MPITQNDDIIDFRNATDEEKKNLVTELFLKQKQLAAFTMSFLNQNSETYSFLSFLISLSISDFKDFFYVQIPNNIFNNDDFTNFFAAKLDEYISNCLVN